MGRVKKSTAVFLLFFLLIGAPSVFSQQLNLPLYRTMNLGWEREFSTRDSLPLHTGFRPLIENELLDYNRFRALHTTAVDTLAQPNRFQRSWFGRKLRKENLFQRQGEDYYIEVNPLFNFEYGRDLAETQPLTYFKNSRGVLVQGHLAGKVSFSASVLENQMRVPGYIRAYAAGIGQEYSLNGIPFRTEAVMPGQGRTKPFGTNGYDFAWAEGYVSYSPLRNLNLQFGHGKLFVGEGYRSMLLSDNAFNYPHFRFTGTFFHNRLQYVSVFASMQQLTRLRVATTPESIFERKAASFHYLSYTVSRKLQVSLFEGTIWRRMNSDQRLLPQDYSFFNPLIGVNAARFGLAAQNNVLLGTQVKYQPFRKAYFYGQVAADDMARHKWAWQVGGKWFDVAGIPNLILQAEVNQATRRTYAHTIVLQNYGHYNQPLAHPAGAGFSELVLLANYRYRDYFLEAKFNFMTFRHYAGAEQWGKDIFLSDRNVPLTEPESGSARLFYQEITLGYLVNPMYNMNVVAGWLYRGLAGAPGASVTNYVYFGFRTSLSNFYYDF